MAQPPHGRSLGLVSGKQPKLRLPASDCDGDCGRQRLHVQLRTTMQVLLLQLARLFYQCVVEDDALVGPKPVHVLRGSTGAGTRARS